VPPLFKLSVVLDEDAESLVLWPMSRFIDIHCIVSHKDQSSISTSNLASVP